MSEKTVEQLAAEVNKLEDDLEAASRSNEKLESTLRAVKRERNGFKARLDRGEADSEKQATSLKEATERADKAEGEAKAARETLGVVVVQNSVMTFGSDPENGIRPEAITDLQLRATTMDAEGFAWGVDENLNVVYQNQKGEAKKDPEDESKPFTMSHWIEPMREASPHLFGEADGSRGEQRASGGSGGSGGGSADRGKMSAAENSAYIAKHGFEKWSQLPQSSREPEKQAA